MNTDIHKKSHPLRDVLLFTLLFNLIAWLAWGMAAPQADEQTRSLAMLIWLLAPLLVSLLVRLFSRNWQDTGFRLKLRGNIGWYGFGILVFLLIIAIVLLLGWLFGAISFSGFELDMFIQSLSMALVFTFVKNIFEEVAWRGFLTPRMDQLVKRPLFGHLLVGLVWGSWHVPYYLRLLDRAVLHGYSPMALPVFIPLMILSMMVAAILFGELRLITGSIWPAVLMHTVSNLLLTSLLVDGFVKVNQSLHWLFTPSWEGLIAMVLILTAGLWLLNGRKTGE